MVLVRGLVAAAAALFSATTATSIPNYGTCSSSDTCLKAVRPNRNAVGDCKAVLQVTVTGKPSTKTITKTACTTKTLTRTNLAVRTATSTIIKSKTNTILTIETSVTSVTQTSVFTPVTTTTVTVTATPDTIPLIPRENAALEQRNNQRPRPAYATKSCNANQYTSACSCIGVRPSTKTVPGPERTTTITRTSTSLVTQTVNQKSTSLVFITRTTNIDKIRTVPTVSTAITVFTQTAPPSTMTVTVTYTLNPDDAVPTGNICARDESRFVVRQLRGASYAYLSDDGNGIASLIPQSDILDSLPSYSLSRSGLLRQRRPDQSFALRTVEENGLTFLSWSENLQGAVLRCEVVSRNLKCQQGDKNTFYLCSAQADGATLAIGNPDTVATSPLGADCEAIRLTTESACAQK